jgi:hypothetical protein
MAQQPDRHLRAMLPILDRPAFGLTAYAVRDPDTVYPLIELRRPPPGAQRLDHPFGKDGVRPACSAGR